MSREENISPLNNQPESLSEDKLKAYLDGILPPNEQHRIELWLAEEGMESDALEGLKKMDQNQRRKSVNNLNVKLSKSVKNRKAKRRKVNPDINIFIAVAVILMLAVICMMVIKYAL